VKTGIQKLFFLVPCLRRDDTQINAMKDYFVYIMASQKNGTLYIGVTNDLHRRVYEHKQGLIKGFTSKYKVNNLVYYELFENIDEALLNEKRLKKWKRSWKIRLIEENNPGWKDLYNELN